MRIVRPEGIASSPNALGKQMGVEVITRHDTPVWGRDFFMFYPKMREVVGADEGYGALRAFFMEDKHHQRGILSQYCDKVLQGVATYRLARDLRKLAPEFIVRPMHHEKGEGYRFTDDALDFDEGNEYITPVFPKTHEYRVVLVYGKVAFIQRKEGGELGPRDCWSNVPFTLIRDHARLHLLHTDAIEKLQAIPVLSAAHIVGVDVLYDRASKDYRVCEVNTCPTLLAPDLNTGRYIRQQVIEGIESHE